MITVPRTQRIGTALNAIPGLSNFTRGIAFDVKNFVYANLLQEDDEPEELTVPEIKETI